MLSKIDTTRESLQGAINKIGEKFNIEVTGELHSQSMRASKNRVMFIGENRLIIKDINIKLENLEGALFDEENGGLELFGETTNIRITTIK